MLIDKNEYIKSNQNCIYVNVEGKQEGNTD